MARRKSGFHSKAQWRLDGRLRQRSRGLVSGLIRRATSNPFLPVRVQGRRSEVAEEESKAGQWQAFQVTIQFFAEKGSS